jgi:3-hydroxyisobutyrate dehydrogenase
VLPVLRHLCRDVVVCGRPPDALRMKLAVNHYLITLVTGLAEAAHFARAYGLDFARFAGILDAGPMASDVSRVKLKKLLDEDFSVQASISDVLMNNTLVVEAARAAGIASPLLDAAHALYTEAERLGLGRTDMVNVIKAVEERSR